jgi:single-stranded-DNA-specific exonuclease
VDAIGFGLGEWASNLPERIDVAYQLEINEWNGNRTLQLNLQDIRPAADN